MRIAHNMMAINTHRQLAGNQLATSKSTEKLSSGYRINRAADDAAGLSISEKMRAQIRGLERASANAQDGISMIQAAEGALQETHSILQRMRELGVQGANDINAAEDRNAIMDELEQLGRELDRISTTTNFNGKYILSGQYADLGVASEDERYAENVTYAGINGDVTVTGALNLQVGANTQFGDVISVNMSGVNAANLLNAGGETEGFWIPPDEYGALGALQREDVGVELPNAAFLDEANANLEDPYARQWTINSFQAMVNVIDGLNYNGTILEADAPKTGIALVNELRSTLGAVQNRLEHTVSNVDTVAENVQAAEARIRDVDMAKEMMNYTKNNILNQAATAMLAQANQAPQSVLQLLQ
jgi:flagellin